MFLPDAVGVRARNGGAAEDGGLELKVGGLYLSALVAEGGGQVVGRVGHGGDQAAAAPGAGGDGDLGVEPRRPVQPGMRDAV